MERELLSALPRRCVPNNSGFINLQQTSYIKSQLKTIPFDRYSILTPALSMKLLRLFHLRENIGPLCWPNVEAKRPSVVHIRAYPSYEPVAKSCPSH